MTRPFRSFLAALLAYALGSNAAAQDAPRAEWIVLSPKAATATEGATLRRLDDDSVLVEGENPAKTVYDLLFETDATDIQAIRIECLTHDSMPGGGPGRAFHGNLVLSEVTAEIQAIGMFGSPEPVTFREAASDHDQNDAQDASKAIDGDLGPGTGWCPEGQKHHDDSRIVLVPKKAFGFRSGASLRIKLHFLSQWDQHTAGRIRVSITKETRMDRVYPLRRPPNDEAIDRSLERGVKYLLSMQQPDGSWVGVDWTLYPVGMTALAAYTLMHCGLRADHPAVRSAMSFVKAHDPIRTYEMGCVLMAYKEAGTPYPSAHIKTLVKRLVDAMGSGDNDNPAFWGYPYGYGYPNDKSPHYDLSNTQYALLGLRAAIACGEKVPPQVFERVGKDVLEFQGDYGSFSYRPGVNPTASMGVAGMTCLIICRDELMRAKGFEGVAKRFDGALAKGEDWLRSNWSVDEVLEVPRNPSPNDRWYYYYVYGLERVGSIWNRKLLGGHDWYSEAATTILKRQAKNGSWGTAYGENDANTCFALLFATRASSLTGSKARRIVAPDDAAAAFTIHANRQNPLVAWVGQLNGAVNDRLELGERVASVDWLLNGQTVASIKPTSAPGAAAGTTAAAGDRIALERFALQWPLPMNGRYALSARMNFVDASNGDAGVEQSNRLEQLIDDVESAWNRESLRDSGNDLVLASAGAAVASTEWDGNYAARLAIDGRHVSSWLSKADDSKPTIRLSFKRPPGATVLKLVQAQANTPDRIHWSRAKEIEVQINSAKPQRYFLLDDSFVKQRIVFKAARISQVRVTIKSLYEGFDQPTAAGFKAIELYALAGGETDEEVSAFGAMEVTLPPGSEKPAEWRYALVDPGADFAGVGIDDSAWRTGNTPFGAGTVAGVKVNTDWSTTTLFARREFTAPDQDPATYQLFVSIDDQAEAWVNGMWIGSIEDYTRQKFRALTIPKGVVKPGRNVIAIKAIDTGGARYLDASLVRFLP